MTRRSIFKSGLLPSGGFTLLELLLVMVIISVMTVFAIPDLRSNLLSDQLKNTTRKVLGIVSETSQEAVSQHAEQRISFDFAENSVSVLLEAVDPVGEQEGRINKYSFPDSVQLVDIMSVHGGKMTNGKIDIRITEKGYIDKTLIHLRSDDGDDMTIMLSPFLGVMKVFDSYVDLEDEMVRY